MTCPERKESVLYYCHIKITSKFYHTFWKLSRALWGSFSRSALEL